MLSIILKTAVKTGKYKECPTPTKGIYKFVYSEIHMDL
jgi:hypothetical protein